LILPFSDASLSRGMPFSPLSKWFFYIFLANFSILMQLGAKHVESPFIELGQISTVFYFLYFTVIMYSVTFVENILTNISNKISNDQSYTDYLTYLIHLGNKIAFISNGEIERGGMFKKTNRCTDALRRLPYNY